MRCPNDVRKTRQTDVIIIGAGCAGWWVSLYLILRGIASILLDTSPPGAYASTANQQWLHQGGLYATYDPITARACREGYELIRARYPEVIHSGIHCYYLMPAESDLARRLDDCQQAGIPAFQVPISSVEARESLLQGNPLRYALRMGDIPVDTSKLLQLVAGQACERGVSFQGVASLEGINPVWDGKVWRVRLDQKHEIQARAIVLACGVYIPEMMLRCRPEETVRFQQTKTPVMILYGDISQSMLITLHAPQGPNLVPFASARRKGVSICLLGLSEETNDYRDRTLPVRFLDQCQASLSDFYPGLARIIRERGAIPARMHACQKIRLEENLTTWPPNRTATCLAYAPGSGEPENLFAFYPGKFTAAPIVARTCAQAVERSLGDWRPGRAQVGAASPIPTIARQRYDENPDYLLTIDHGRLVYRPIQ